MSGDRLFNSFFNNGIDSETFSDTTLRRESELEGNRAVQTWECIGCDRNGIPLEGVCDICGKSFRETKDNTKPKEKRDVLHQYFLGKKSYRVENLEEEGTIQSWGCGKCGINGIGLDGVCTGCGKTRHEVQDDYGNGLLEEDN